MTIHEPLPWPVGEIFLLAVNVIGASILLVVSLLGLRTLPDLTPGLCSLTGAAGWLALALALAARSLELRREIAVTPDAVELLSFRPLLRPRRVSYPLPATITTMPLRTDDPGGMLHQRVVYITSPSGGVLVLLTVTEAVHAALVDAVCGLGLPPERLSLIEAERRSNAPLQTVCTVCGYSLLGLKDPVCPECGSAVPGDVFAAVQRGTGVGGAVAGSEGIQPAPRAN